MLRMLVSLAAVGLLGASECRAQFVDNFDGEALAPHWEISSDPSHLEHTVGGGVLTVTDLPYPSGKHSPTNWAGIRSLFAPVSGDFLAQAVMGWAPGESRNFEWSLASFPETHSIASVQYSDGGSGAPFLRIRTAGGTSLFPAPAPGMHEFAFERQGSTLRAYMDGNLVLTAAANPQQSVGLVGVAFWIDYPNSGMQPLYVDLIHVVPSPAASLSLLLGAVACSARRKR